MFYLVLRIVRFDTKILLTSGVIITVLDKNVSFNAKTGAANKSVG